MKYFVTSLGMYGNSRALMLGTVLCLIPIAATAQTVATQAAEAPSPVNRTASGDAPDDPGPLATDVSPAITHAAIRKATAKVGDWQLAHAEKVFNQQWTFAALYDGLITASKTTGNPRYRDAVEKYASHSDWKLLNLRFPHADDMAFGKAYLDLYRDTPKAKRDPARIADTKQILDQLVARPDDPKKLLWWWCDALYMAPPVLARMSLITGDRRYLDYMDKEWWETSASDLLGTRQWLGHGIVCEGSPGDAQGLSDPRQVHRAVRGNGR